MNPITEALRSGYAALQSLGESVTFRGEVLSVPQINRAPTAKLRDGYNFRENTQSIIHLPAVLAEPEAGEVVSDQFSKSHRIQQIHFDSVVWVCGCTVSNA